MFFAAIVVIAAGSDSTPRTDGRLRQSASSLAATPFTSSIWHEQDSRLSRLFAFNTSSRFLMCMAPKTGCTGFLEVATLVNLNISMGDARKNPGIIHTKYIADLRVYSWDGQQSSPFSSYPRVIVARNPYIRFISSYLDWQHRFDGERNVSFRQFTHFVQRRDFQGYQVLWDHIWPVSRECGTTRLGYDFVLRLEEMNLWYSAFLLHFDLRYFVDALSADGFNLFELTMNDDALLRDYSAQVTGLSPWGGKAWNSSHHRGSADKVAEYYTPELAGLVFDIQREDFVNFGYPAWNGDKHTFRYVR